MLKTFEKTSSCVSERFPPPSGVDQGTKKRMVGGRGLNEKMHCRYFVFKRFYIMSDNFSITRWIYKSPHSIIYYLSYFLLNFTIVRIRRKPTGHRSALTSWASVADSVRRAAFAFSRIDRDARIETNVHNVIIERCDRARHQRGNRRSGYAIWRLARVQNVRPTDSIDIREHRLRGSVVGAFVSRVNVLPPAGHVVRTCSKYRWCTRIAWLRIPKAILHIYGARRQTFVLFEKCIYDA